MLNGGYILLDLTPYENGEKYLELVTLFADLLAKGKPIVVKLADTITPTYASLYDDTTWFRIDLITNQSLETITLTKSDGSYAIAETQIGGGE